MGGDNMLRVQSPGQHRSRRYVQSCPTGRGWGKFCTFDERERLLDGVLQPGRVLEVPALVVARRRRVQVAVAAVLDGNNHLAKSFGYIPAQRQP